MFHTTIEAAEAVVAERRRQASRTRETARPGLSTTSRRRLVAALLSGAALLPACGTPAPVESPVTEAQAGAEGGTSWLAFGRMARLHHLHTVVLVRPKTTTTYHFGLVTPICERTPTEGEAAPEPVQLSEAIAGRKEEAKRLCNKCADLVAQWGRAALVVAGAPGLEHPGR